MDEEIKRKISESKKGKNKGTLNHFYGKKHKPESIEKMRERARLRPKPSDETLKKRSESLKERWKDPNSGFHSEERAEKLKDAQLGEKGSNWQGGIDDDSCHNRAWKLFGKDHCEICGMSNEDHKKKHKNGSRLSMHNTLTPKDYTVMEPEAWMTVCEFGCHTDVEGE